MKHDENASKDEKYPLDKYLQASFRFYNQTKCIHGLFFDKLLFAGQKYSTTRQTCNDMATWVNKAVQIA